MNLMYTTQTMNYNLELTTRVHNKYQVSAIIVKRNFHRHTQFAKILMIMALDMAELNRTINIDHTITLPLDGGGNETMMLRGITYHGGYHFTSRAIDTDQNI
jgi:hypothetical protein